jgi:DNA-directed RNA polymerase subunit beta
MEILKRTLQIEESKGWYLLQNESKVWIEDFTDEETGEVTSVERSEVVLNKGCKLTEIDILTLKENGITSVRVSNIQLKGNKQEHMNLWDTSLKIRNKNGEKKKTYIVTAESPTAAETFISDYLEVNVECTFEAVKVSKLEYNKVIKLYDTEREEYEADGRHWIRWYKSQIFAMIEGDEDTETGSNPVKNILVQATDFETALKAIKTVMGRDEYDEIYNAFKSMQELNIEEVFIPDESVSYYSNSEVE